MSILDKKNRVQELVKLGKATFENFYPSLYLDVKSPGKASWIIRYQLYGKRRHVTVWYFILIEGLSIRVSDIAIY